MADRKNTSIKPDLKAAELDQIYDLSLKLLQKSHDPDKLMDALLDEYIRRFDELAGRDLSVELEQFPDETSREKARALFMFARQAALIKENAEYQARLKARNRELAALTRKLQLTNEELQRLNSHYLNMLGFVSHELRSPLISILGFAELLEEGILGDLNEEQRNSIEVIIRVTRNLIDMIRNYLDLAQIEAGELAIDWQEVNLYHDIILPVVGELEGHLLAKHMRVVQVGNALPIPRLVVQGDSGLLKIVFTNILSNAIKYGAPRSNIEWEVRDTGESFLISITNQGDGVPEDKLDKIFQKFSQMVHLHPDQPRGTGLGLFNTRCIVEAHGGSIWAESEYGKWFRINLVLPHKPPRKPRFVRLQPVHRGLSPATQDQEAAVSGRNEKAAKNLNKSRV